MDEFQRQKIARLVAVVLWLIARADDRGMTHGEKHHFHRVAIDTLQQIQTEIGAQRSLYPVTSDDVPNEIPF